MSEIEFADDPAFVAGIVDPCDLASGRQSDVRRLLVQLTASMGATDRGGERQCRFELGDERAQPGRDCRSPTASQLATGTEVSAIMGFQNSPVWRVGGSLGDQPLS